MEENDATAEKKTPWKPVMITLIAGFLLSLSSCYAFLSRSNSNYAGVFAGLFIVGVVAVIGGGVAAIIFSIRETRL